MKHVYTLLASILILASVVTSATAQRSSTTITRAILGCVLGKSTIEEVKGKMLEVGAEIKKQDHPSEWETSLVVEGVPFAQTKASVLFIFFGGKLSSYSALFPNKEDADRVNLGLMKKYEKGESLENLGYEGYKVTDPNTELVHVYVYSEDHKKEFIYSILSYKDIALNRGLDRLKASDL